MVNSTICAKYMLLLVLSVTVLLWTNTEASSMLVLRIEYNIATCTYILVCDSEIC